MTTIKATFDKSDEEIMELLCNKEIMATNDIMLLAKIFCNMSYDMLEEFAEGFPWLDTNKFQFSFRNEDGCFIAGQKAFFPSERHKAYFLLKKSSR